ncbi:MAG TPA: septal ring lytic transglycosylase RlpA family protein [Drouetiella sp.]|jgi:rare lipoprotein A
MSYIVRYLCAVAFVLLMFAVPAFSSPVRKIEKMFHGVASYYADKFNGHKTASGDIFDNSKLTCAHRTLPFGTKILVKNPDTGSCCEVVVNDRGPYAHNRVVDLSKAAARKLGITGLGKVVCYAGKSVVTAAGKTVVNAIDLEIPGKSDHSTVAKTGPARAIASADTPSTASAAAAKPTSGTVAAGADLATSDMARAD